MFVAGEEKRGGVPGGAVCGYGWRGTKTNVFFAPVEMPYPISARKVPKQRCLRAHLLAASSAPFVEGKTSLGLADGKGGDIEDRWIGWMDGVQVQVRSSSRIRSDCRTPVGLLPSL